MVIASYVYRRGGMPNKRIECAPFGRPTRKQLCCLLAAHSRRWKLKNDGRTTVRCETHGDEEGYAVLRQTHRNGAGDEMRAASLGHLLLILLGRAGAGV